MKIGECPPAIHATYLRMVTSQRRSEWMGPALRRGGDAITRNDSIGREGVISSTDSFDGVFTSNSSIEREEVSQPAPASEKQVPSKTSATSQSWSSLQQHGESVKHYEQSEGNETPDADK